MESRPYIGINMDVRVSSTTKSLFSVIHSGYYDCVIKAGGTPIMLPPVTKQHDLEPLLELIDGLILVDGDDLNPKRLGMKPHMASRVMVQRREDADRLLCRIAIDRRIPLLAVGTGMQLLNVLCGGSLYQHLPEDLPKCLPHFDPHGGFHRHLLEMTPGTRIDEIYGPGDLRVNSHHHQAVHRVAPNFRVSALAPDGVVEAIEPIDPNWFCVGVQWNPAIHTGSALDLQLFEALVEAARSRRTSVAAAA